MKQVVVGKLKPSESFGEISVIMKEPMTCSIVTETECKIGLIPCDQLHSKQKILLFIFCPRKKNVCKKILNLFLRT